jgi:hypothetical protein
VQPDCQLSYLHGDFQSRFDAGLRQANILPEANSPEILYEKKIAMKALRECCEAAPGRRGDA